MSKPLHSGDPSLDAKDPWLATEAMTRVTAETKPRLRPMFIESTEALPVPEAIALSDLVRRPYTPPPALIRHHGPYVSKKSNATSRAPGFMRPQSAQSEKKRIKETGLGILVTVIILNGNKDRLVYLARRNEECFSFPRFDFKFKDENDAEQRSAIFGGFISEKLCTPVSDIAFVSKRDVPMRSRGGQRSIGQYESRYLFTGQYDKTDFNRDGRRKVSSLRNERFDLHEGLIADLVPRLYRPLLIPLRYLIVGLLQRRAHRNNPALIEAEQAIIKLCKGG